MYIKILYYFTSPANLSESENNDTPSTENSDYVIVSNEESNEDISNGNIPVENKTENNTIQPEKTEINQEECQKCKPMSLEEENKMLKKARMCKICMDSEVFQYFLNFLHIVYKYILINLYIIQVNIVFLPCGHLVSCTACAAGLLQCPICRASIKGVVRTYLS